MNETIRYLSVQFQKREISKDEFINKLPLDLKTDSFKLRGLFMSIMDDRSSEDLIRALTIMWLLKKEGEQLDILNRLLIESWHTRHEDIIHEIQKRKKSSSVPYIKEAMQKQYDYLKSYGTGLRQFINQCGHALVSIGTKEALDVIYELAESKSPILRDEMLYRISRIEHTNDYTRNYELDE
jgi:hypothetical protein